MIYILAVSREEWGKKKKEKKRRKGEKEEGRGKKVGNDSKKEGKYPYFVFCLIWALMTAKKSRQKTGKNLKNLQGGEGFFWVAIIYTPV